MWLFVYLRIAVYKRNCVSVGKVQLGVYVEHYRHCTVCHATPWKVVQALLLRVSPVTARDCTSMCATAQKHNPHGVCFT